MMKGNILRQQQQQQQQQRRRHFVGTADYFMTFLRGVIARTMMMLHGGSSNHSNSIGSGIACIKIVLILIISIQSFWILYDQNVTSQIYHKPPKVYIKPTETSPLTPFYDEPYDGFAKAFTVWSYPSFPARRWGCHFRVAG